MCYPTPLKKSTTAITRVTPSITSAQEVIFFARSNRAIHRLIPIPTKTNGDGVPDLVWQNQATGQVDVFFYGGAGGAVYQGWNWINSTGVPGWSVIVPKSR